MTTKLPFRQSFYIGDRLIGTVMRDWQAVYAQRAAPLSYAFCCPTCGDIWARAVTTDVLGGASPYQFVSRGCAVHWKLFQAASLQLPWDKPYSDALPESVVQWELINLIDNMSKDA